MDLTALEILTYYWWRPYLVLSRKRRQMRIGVQRRRRDNLLAGPEYRWISIGWQL
jgi:hypothetical protein